MINGVPPTFHAIGQNTPAYPFWTGEEWKQGSKKRAAIKFPLFDEMRDGGRLCPDGQWRYVITMEDAIAGGFNLANIEKLRNRYNTATFDMLYMCVFVDSKDSVFSFSDTEACGVEVDTGRITIRTLNGRLVTGQSGAALTRHAAAICRVSSSSPRRCLPWKNSVC